MAIPVSTLNRVADELVRQGRIRRGYLGVGTQAVPIPSSLREKLGLECEYGLILLSVEPNSPAEKAGWQLGDILVKLNGTPVLDVDELQAVLRGDSVGRQASALLVRGGARLEGEVTIEERPNRDK
jgi:S1-C subfamily serine protease